MRKTLSLTLTLLSALSLFLVFFVSPIHAQTTPAPSGAPYARAWFEQDLKTFQNTLYESKVRGGTEMNLETFTYGHTNMVLLSLATLLAEFDYQKPAKELHPADASDSNIYQKQIRGGAIIQLAQLMDTLLVSKPLDTTEYLAYVGKNAGIVQPAYAQEAKNGSGWAMFFPIMNIWKVFRNMAYMLFIVMFGILGLMIMFRMPVGNGVVTIQNSIPRIITTLLLVTFSYAISALIVDMMFVLSTLSANLFVRSNLVGADIVAGILNNNPFEAFLGLIGAITGTGTADFWSDKSGWLWNIGMTGYDMAHSTISRGIITFFLVSVLSSLSILSSGAVEGLALLLFIVFGIIILWKILQVIFMLLKAYVSLILGAIFSPIMLMMNIIPGSNAAYSWFMMMVANALIFPVVIILFMVAVALFFTNPLDSASWWDIITMGLKNADNKAGLVLPLITYGTTWVFGLGFILILPSMLEAIYKVLGVQPGITAAAGGALGATVGGFVGTISGMGMRVAENAAIKPFGDLAGNQYNAIKGKVAAGTSSRDIIRGLGKDAVSGVDKSLDKFGKWFK